MVLKWFDAKEEKTFGESLARFYMERSPVSEPGKPAKFVAKRQEELLGKIAQQLSQFKMGRKLNIYKKAQLGNAFKWALKDAGYDSAYVDQLTSWLMLRC
jgi:hypothetical protein